MIYIVYAIHVLICLFLILVVLLQQGSGADLSVFGGGGTQTAFGARSATNLLHKLTVAGFVGFIMTTIAIGFLKTGSSGSVMSEVEQTAPAEVGGEDAEAVPAAPVSEDPAAETTGQTPVESGTTAPPSGDDASASAATEDPGGP